MSRAITLFGMKRWLWILAAISASTAVYFTIRYGLRPKPIPILNASEFANLEQIGAVVYRRLRHEVRAERIVLLGSAADIVDGNRVWLGFMKAAAADRERFVFFFRSDLPHPDLPAEWEAVAFENREALSGELQTKIESHLKSGRLILVHGLTPDVSHLARGPWVKTIEGVAQHPVLAIATLPFALGDADRDSFRTQCLNEEPPGESKLACAVQRVSRRYQRRNLDAGKIWAVMERHGLKEYLVFVKVPGSFLGLHRGAR